ncbi:MAG: hypothetical protein Q8Q01_05535 [archaeon]|nr:hypothetical protein [archaeon]
MNANIVKINYTVIPSELEIYRLALLGDDLDTAGRARAISDLARGFQSELLELWDRFPDAAFVAVRYDKRLAALGPDEESVIGALARRCGDVWVDYIDHRLPAVYAPDFLVTADDIRESHEALKESDAGKTIRLF